MSVIPFRRTKKPPPPPKSEQMEPERCGRCGWTIPAVVKVDPNVFRGRMKQIVFRVECPECGAEVILLAEFE